MVFKYVEKYIGNFYFFKIMLTLQHFAKLNKRYKYTYVYVYS